ncbi:hypothetical protein HYH02_012393 [Chlamydomonas schloesseri]|uniref:Uncharacterized protein n=1 Tax=Chlamydomonas schloesseri TaxID=2026947 RepID=A0A835W060_9CHLO|nr:hypothetical protein HYH02_012393 [Chlamydomonas schloesseri]|eukprot:KAG2434380.1 hypothetical protein HYH02_012393 [Chlamydomonas schloesseri]
MPWFDPNQEEQLAAKAALEKVTCVRPVGSWARQTAVTQGFDIDVVAFVRRFEGTDVTSLEMWRGDKLTRMRRHVKDQLQAADPSWKVEVRNDAHYQHVLHVTVGEVEVDLLLAPDCTAGGKVGKMWASTQHKRLRKPLLSNPAATVFDLVRHRSDSAALIEFYIGALADVLEVMRFVKGLYKYGVQVAPGCEHIRSLSLEVLVLAAHQRLRSTKYRRNPKGRAYKMELLVEFLRLVVAAVEKREVVMLDVSYWCRAVQPYGYSREVGMQYVHIWGNDPMIVIHPTDFTCNLERPPEGRAASDWSGLVQLAERLLARLERNDVVGFWAEPEVVRAMVHAVRLRRAIVEGDGHHRRLRQYLGGAAPVKRARKQSRVLRAVR